MNRYVFGLVCTFQKRAWNVTSTPVLCFQLSPVPLSNTSRCTSGTPFTIGCFVSKLHVGFLKRELLQCVLCSVAKIDFCSMKQALPYIRRMDCGESISNSLWCFSTQCCPSPRLVIDGHFFPVSVLIRLPLTPSWH